MGKVRLKLLSQLYITRLSVRDLDNFRPLDFVEQRVQYQHTCTQSYLATVSTIGQQLFTILYWNTGPQHIAKTQLWHAI
jgi:hypothetical protein